MALVSKRHTSMSENNAVGDVPNVAEKTTIVEKVAGLFGGTYFVIAIAILFASFMLFIAGGSVDDRQLDDELIVAGYDLGYNWTSDNITTFEKEVRVDNNLIAADVDAKMYELQCSSGFVEACDYMSVREAVQDTSNDEYLEAISPFCGMFFVAFIALFAMVFWAETIAKDARNQRLEVHSAQ